MAEQQRLGFLVYRTKHLRKINSMRDAISQPWNYKPVILTKGQALYTPAEQMEGEPASCYNCVAYNLGKSCMKMGPGTRIRKLVWPDAAVKDEKRIEYWPCCSMWDRGEPNAGPEKFISSNDPDYAGLIWINAPEVGQPRGGANCGGINGGDDCDYYMTETDDKRSAPMGFCRVMQTKVANGDVCSCWKDDDELTWRRAQEILAGGTNGRGKSEARRLGKADSD